MSVKQRRDIRHDYVRNYVTFCVSENQFFLFRHTVMIQLVTVFMMIRSMAVILMILTVYVAEQSV